MSEPSKHKGTSLDDMLKEVGHQTEVKLMAIAKGIARDLCLSSGHEIYAIYKRQPPDCCCEDWEPVLDALRVAVRAERGRWVAHIQRRIANRLHVLDEHDREIVTLRDILACMETTDD